MWVGNFGILYLIHQFIKYILYYTSEILNFIYKCTRNLIIFLTILLIFKKIIFNVKTRSLVEGRDFKINNFFTFEIILYVYINWRNIKIITYLY